MDALHHLARRGWHPRLKSAAPSRDSEPRAEWIAPRLGQGARRDWTPSPARRDPRADALVPRRAPEPRPASPVARRGPDPRWYQIAMLSALLGYGVFGLRFGLGWDRIAAVIGAALGVQFLCTKLWRLPAYDPLSALISGIGLCTLLRTNGVALAMLAAALAIASKFVLRWRGKHLYNPTNLALTVMLIAGAGWISPGQYGHVAFVALLMVCMGLAVVSRAGRSDVTLAFLGVYAAILFGRSLWLGEPLTIPTHRLQSGLLLQFAFNMISDPRTTPDSRAGRLLFGALVALGAGVVQFALFRTNGPVWSLAACTPLVPLLDRWLPGPRYQWKPTVATAGATQKGAIHETSVPAVGAVRGTLAIGRP
jgi:hypothetical protein